jgi:hypothetical protein
MPEVLAAVSRLAIPAAAAARVGQMAMDKLARQAVSRSVERAEMAIMVLAERAVLVLPLPDQQAVRQQSGQHRAVPRQALGAVAVVASSMADRLEIMVAVAVAV